VFRSSATASFHAEKSGHQEFEESTEEVSSMCHYEVEADDQIKPLTEEEKKAKLAELRQKLAEKRAKQSVEEIQVNKANEALRRKAGQVSSPCPSRDIELIGRMLER
jgi:ribosomal protein L29